MTEPTKKLLLFDIDGTLVHSGEKISAEMISVIENLSKLKNIDLGLVGGGTLDKIKWQMDTAVDYFKYIFAECGAIVSVSGKVVKEKNMIDFCDRTNLNAVIKEALRLISEMPIIYHGNQIDFRKGLVYISPPGMQATQFERTYFLAMDKTNNLRENLLENLQKIDSTSEFEICFGGSIGIAVYPKGWNKSQVITYLKEVDFDFNNDIYYFGDRTEPDGNDYPLFSHQLVNGISVKDFYNTIVVLNNLFLKN